MGLLSWITGKPPRSIITEPLNIVTGSLGSGKTLFAIEQADLLRQGKEPALVYQVGINEPDLRHLPALPFPLEQWHERADAGELKNAVIIVDEFHRWMPQRGPGRPPKFIEEMAEARKRGVRFIFLTQSQEFDHFLKGTRLNRHFYLSRKAGLKQSTIWEWTAQFVGNPESNKDAREQAIKHLGWRHPIKKYGDWYVSAKSHHFRPRIPLRLMLVPFFIAAVVWFVVKAFDTVGGLMDPVAVAEAKAAETNSAGALSQQQTFSSSEGNTLPVKLDPVDYLNQFVPIVPTIPSSAPAFQGREVLAKPQLLCVSSGPGVDGQGERVAGRCRCYTEQATVYAWISDDAVCRELAAQPRYDPFRAPADHLDEGGGGADGEALTGPRPSPPSAVSVTIAPPSAGSAGVGIAHADASPY